MTICPYVCFILCILTEELFSHGPQVLIVALKLSCRNIYVITALAVTRACNTRKLTYNYGSLQVQYYPYFQQINLAFTLNDRSLYLLFCAIYEKYSEELKLYSFINSLYTILMFCNY